MDSLSIRDGGKPHKYVTKIFPLPHVKAAMCGIGNLNIVIDWFSDLQLNAVVCKFPFLNELVPTQLLKIGDKYPTEGHQTTIYHFGFDEEERRFRGFKFRSDKNYQMEELDYGIGIRPYGEKLHDILINGLKHLQLNEAIVKLMVAQKAKDESLNPEKRAGIGGEIHILQITEDSQFLWCWRRFPDFFEVFNKMMQNLNSD